MHNARKNHETRCNANTPVFIVKRNMKARFFKRGAVALSSILMLSMLLLVIGLAMAFSEYMQSSIVYNQDKSSDAFYAAESGIKDAMQKVAKNKDYENPSYCLMMGKNRADVAVVKLSGQTEIISSGISGVADCASAGTNYKKIKAVLNVSNNGKIEIFSWEELAN